MIHVQISDPNHPHFPEYGVLTGHVIEMKYSKRQMAEVKLDHCQHGTEGCFVEKGQVREVKRESV